MPEFEPLTRSFYLPSASVVAPRLLGHFLMRRTRRGLCGGIIVETEAYLHDDPACHAAPGPTKRNQSMFGPPGHAYVYFIYGCHYCVNAVCGPAGVGEAVLIRALVPTIGLELMRGFRPVSGLRNLANGPAKLCEAMDLGRKLDGTDLCDSGSELWIAANKQVKAFLDDQGPIRISPRIGITKAASLPLRFYLKSSHHVSGRERNITKSRSGNLAKL